MIGGYRTQFSGQFRAAARLKLVGVELDGEAVRARREEDAAALVDGEDARLAEHVGEASELLAGDRGNHLSHE